MRKTGNQVVKDFYLSILTQINIKVKRFRIDNTLEYGITDLKKQATTNTVKLEFSALYTLEQNGITEAANKVVLTKAQSILINSGLPA